MNTYKLSNGWTATSNCINVKTGEEVEMTDEVRLKLIDQMLSGAGYKRVE
jgi:hypothetical protein